MKKLNLAPAVASLAAAGLLVTAMACAGAAQQARGPASSSPPTPTAVPAQAREMAVVFVREHQSIGQDWDKFNSDLDEWRTGPTACDRAVGQGALDGFAARASQITQDARRLPRTPVLRDLSDQLIQAAERQETSLSRLRDAWQPANPAAYEVVEAELAAAAKLRQTAQDGLYDLQIQVDPSAQPAVREFSSALQSVNATWDGAHQNFDSYRTQTGPEAADRLNRVMVGIGDVVAGARSLPASPATSEWAWTLAQAAAGEDQALRKLREPPASDEAKAKDLAAADAQILQGNAVRGRVQRQVVNVLNTPADNQRAVAEFAKQHTPLAEDWDRLGQDYDGWRHGVGGCDASKAIAALDQFVVRSSALARRAQNLPSGTLLRSLQEPLSEAAVRQAEAIKALRGSWRPYATDLYKTLDQERASAAGLRRQVAAGVQDLKARLGLPAASQ